MSNEDIDDILELINQLEVTVQSAQRKIEKVKNRLHESRKDNNKGNEHPPNRKHGGLRVGDRVRIKNSVRLKGDIRRRVGVLSTVVRFTKEYVVVQPTSRKDQEIRKYSSNLEIASDNE